MKEDTRGILERIRSEDFRPGHIRNLLSDLNVVDIADLFGEIDREKVVQIFRMLPKDLAADVFSYISSEQQQLIVESIADSEVRHIVDELFVDDAVDFLEEMPASVVKKVLKNTNSELREVINQLLKYPENSAGSLMTIEYVDLKKSMTVRQSIDRLRQTGLDKETIDVCFVTDSQRILEGDISLRSLLMGKDDDVIENLMGNHTISVKTTDDQEYVSGVFMKYDLYCLPVVDNEKRLVGIITVDDIVDVIQEENTEDFQIMAATTPSEKPYLKTNVLRLAGNRIPWLLFLMLSATFTGAIIGAFEEQLAIYSGLIAFIPMLMDTGGNSGSQASTLVIRGIALGEIKLGNLFTIVRKELSVALICGLVLSLVNFLRILLTSKDLRVAVTVCLSVYLTVLFANVIGGVLPILAKAIKLDPALMASPLITTIVDAISLLAYFSIAKTILQI